MNTIATKTGAAARRARLDALVVQMYADYQGGLTLAEVGAKHGGRPMSAVYSLFRRRGLPRRKRHTPGVYARIAATRRSKLDGLIVQMHADYMRPMTLHDVGRKYSRSASAVRELFVKRGLHVRPFKSIARQANGSPERYVPFTDEQIDALIAGETVLHVPAALKFEWRRWSLERRGEFIARLRARLARPTDRPTTPFSANVKPFDYASPYAHAIVARMNAGTDSRTARVKLDICSQGVIWDDRLWFWSHKVGYQCGPWKKEHGRPSLHKTIWQETHGRKVPPAHVVRFIDGNPNNLAPENLRLATRNDLARENQAAALQRKSRERTALLLNRSQTKKRHGLTDTLLATRR